MKLGFICEGKTEKKIVESENFQQLLTDLNHTCVPDIIDAKGNGNLLPKYLDSFSQRLKANEAEKIIIITDLDEDACITLTKERIAAKEDHIIIVSVKKIEAWFLADSNCMSSICGTEIQHEFPEEVLNPFETIKEYLISHTSRGIGDKILLAAKMINNNFSVANAAKHANCNSAKYLIQKLQSLSE
jgi:hypothetical protein